MIYFLQFVLLALLIVILVTLFNDDRKKRKAGIPAGTLMRIWNGSERRRFVRVGAHVPVRYSISISARPLKVTKTHNVSIGGICINLNEKLMLNSLLFLEIEISSSPAGHTILAKGEVVWIDEETGEVTADGIRHFTAGIEFKEMSSRDREKLADFVKKAPPSAESG